MLDGEQLLYVRLLASVLIRIMSSTLTDGIYETLWIADVVGIDPNKFMGFVFVKNAGLYSVLLGHLSKRKLDDVQSDTRGWSCIIHT